MAAAVSGWQMTSLIARMAISSPLLLQPRCFSVGDLPVETPEIWGSRPYLLKMFLGNVLGPPNTPYFSLKTSLYATILPLGDVKS